MRDLDAMVRQRIERARVARLATVRPDGRPHVVPVTFAFDGETIVTVVDDKPKRTVALQRLRNIAAHPEVSVLVDHYAEDWTALWWVRADGTAHVVQDGAIHEQACARLAARYAAYRERPPTGPVIVVTVQRWVTWSAGLA